MYHFPDLPICKTQIQTYAVAENENIQLKCSVDARPMRDLTFIWLFNNTLETVEVDTSRIKSNGQESYMMYSPLSARDYGTLSCWATNEVGMQIKPCIFTLIETGKEMEFEISKMKVSTLYCKKYMLYVCI